LSVFQYTTFFSVGSRAPLRGAADHSSKNVGEKGSSRPVGRSEVLRSLYCTSTATASNCTAALPFPVSADETASRPIGANYHSTGRARGSARAHGER
jgi:hypothetical protein